MANKQAVWYGMVMKNLSSILSIQRKNDECGWVFRPCFIGWITRVAVEEVVRCECECMSVVGGLGSFRDIAKLPDFVEDLL